MNMQVPLEIYTDGAWERKRGTIDEVFMYGSDAHIEGSAGIVITAASEHWRSMGVHCFRITYGALIASLSVFPLELLASVVAIKIAACLHCYCEVFTDCQSVQKILSHPKMLRAFSAKENLILLQIGLTDGFDIKTSWIPGHPEKTVPNSDI